MNTDEIEVQLSITEMRISYLREDGDGECRGNLLAATPSMPKPAELSMEAWAVAVLRAARAASLNVVSIQGACAACLCRSN